MPTEVSGPFMQGNSCRVTFKTKDWDDLQTSAEEMAASIYKLKDNGELEALPDFQGVTPAPDTSFWEELAGEYRYKIDTSTFSSGTYYVVFAGKVSGDGFKEPISFQVTNDPTAVGG